MKRIKNAWASHPGYQCFGCCHDNHSGLQMDFYEDGDEIISVWKPRPEYQGWINVLHGGIQATLADEIASWVVFRKLQTTGMTAKMEIRYKKSISTNDDHITLRAHLVSFQHNLANIEVLILNEKDEVCATAQCVYSVVPPEKAKTEGFKEFEVEE